MQSSKYRETSSIELSKVVCIFTSSSFEGGVDLISKLFKHLNKEALGFDDCKISKRLCY